MTADPANPCPNHHAWTNICAEDWAARQSDEPLGTKEKFWVTDPKDERWLFKFARVANDGVTSGEDWAECLVHELSRILDVPTAHANIGSFDGRRGVLSLNVASHPRRLEHGDELLAATHSTYQAGIIRDNPHHTVTDVKASLTGIGVPPEWLRAPFDDAFDLWAGYIMMDAWVSGTDRHAQNWAAVRDGNEHWLAPSFDHGNALGFQLRDEKREQLVTDPSKLLKWAGRGVNTYFARSPSLVEVASSALDAASDAARMHWIGTLQRIEQSQIESAIDQVPDQLLSDVGRIFCGKLLELNRERILNACASGS